MKKEKLDKIKSKIHRARDKQIGNIRFPEDSYNRICEIADELKITKQWLIQQIVIDFLIED